MVTNGSRPEEGDDDALEAIVKGIFGILKKPLYESTQNHLDVVGGICLLLQNLW